MTTVLIVFLVIISFIGMGILGWIIKIFGFAGAFLTEGVWSCLGCLFQVLIWGIILMLLFGQMVL